MRAGGRGEVQVVEAWATVGFQKNGRSSHRIKRQQRHLDRGTVEASPRRLNSDVKHLNLA